MANVLIFFRGIKGVNKTLIPCFYNGFINSLKRNGNNVLYIPTNEFLIDPFDGENILKIETSEIKLRNIITDFDPDLVITFNNSIYKKTAKIVDCPILVWMADTPFYYSDKKELRNNVDRYTFILSTKHFMPEFKHYFKVKSKNLHIVPFATDIRAKAILQNKNISFIGSNFTPPMIPHKILKTKFEKIKQHIIALEKNQKIVNHFLGDFDLPGLLSKNNRIQVLEKICDLGLTIYGTKSWTNAQLYSFKLALAYNDKSIFSLKENQDVYNSSKVCINISHMQAKGGVPWRVCDIMASNGCLVSDYREDIKERFGKYVDIPMYHTPSEAYDLCKKLLKDDKWRTDIVKASQLAIEETSRFEHTLKDLEQITGIPLLKNKKGRAKLVKKEKYHKHPVALASEKIARKIYHSIPISQSIRKKMTNNLKWFYANYLPFNKEIKKHKDKIKKRKWDSKAKLEIVIEGIKGRPTNEICDEYMLSRSQYYKWRKQLLSEGLKMFELEKQQE